MDVRSKLCHVKRSAIKIAVQLMKLRNYDVTFQQKIRIEIQIEFCRFAELNQNVYGIFTVSGNVMFPKRNIPPIFFDTRLEKQNRDFERAKDFHRYSLHQE